METNLLVGVSLLGNVTVIVGLLRGFYWAGDLRARLIALENEVRILRKRLDAPGA